jgi:predicted transcriptional regulator
MDKRTLKTEIDISGKTYGMLTAIRHHHYGRPRNDGGVSYNYWLFKCKCGKEKVMIKGAVTAGNSRSCGGCKIRDTSDLRERRKQKYERLFQSVDMTSLTSRQKEIADLCLQGYSQPEIADKLDLNQSSVNKHINGTTTHTRENNFKRKYGGILNKIEKNLDRQEKVEERRREKEESRSVFSRKSVLDEQHTLQLVIDVLTKQRNTQREETNRLSAKIRLLEDKLLELELSK